MQGKTNQATTVDRVVRLILVPRGFLLSSWFTKNCHLLHQQFQHKNKMIIWGQESAKLCPFSQSEERQRQGCELKLTTFLEQKQKGFPIPGFLSKTFLVQK